MRAYGTFNSINLWRMSCVVQWQIFHRAYSDVFSTLITTPIFAYSFNPIPYLEVVNNTRLDLFSLAQNRVRVRGNTRAIFWNSCVYFCLCPNPSTCWCKSAWSVATESKQSLTRSPAQLCHKARSLCRRPNNYAIVTDRAISNHHGPCCVPRTKRTYPK